MVGGIIGEDMGSRCAGNEFDGVPEGKGFEAYPVPAKMEFKVPR